MVVMDQVVTILLWIISINHHIQLITYNQEIIQILVHFIP